MLLFSYKNNHETTTYGIGYVENDLLILNKLARKIRGYTLRHEITLTTIGCGVDLLQNTKISQVIPCVYTAYPAGAQFLPCKSNIYTANTRRTALCFQSLALWPATCTVFGCRSELD